MSTSGREMFAAAPSKLPFYVAGGALAIWAVVLATWGIGHLGEFPGSQAKGRLAMLTSFVLMAATVTAAVLTAGEDEEGAAAPERAPQATGRTLELAADPGGRPAFDKERSAVLAGRVTVRFTNDATVPHDVTIVQGSRTVGATKRITQSSARLAVNLAAGEYVYFCSVPGHRQSGMEGTLTVE
jgi:plastocyanin